ncbi:MAG TPA: tRNA uridine(34) 5-carboxymethylaminomethyl modification radical SAM/GNAT enzyme Elp3 [Candidatus Magasanikbacteria bacterium]|nr:tRNA uridine(34) 5-carboxymethylaminomethyl modification radical SAM/GNAT enzyme Elp3 [Candidatus Magasanikbacteria bacterium]
MDKLAEKIIIKAAKIKKPTMEALDAIKRDFLRTNKDTKDIPKKSDLLAVYHELLQKNKIKKSVVLEKLLTKRAVRTLSGVSIITVLTKPYPCPGKCIYCPNEKAMPKSYISDEPAAARALQLHFDPYEQVVRRIESLQKNGHPTDKIELIVKGGTWNAYPLQYQYWFIVRCFQAANKSVKFIKPIKSIKSLKEKLILEQKKNEKAKHRIIGLTLETRPDFINEKTVWEMREQGCTRVELGAQTIDDKVLKLIKRGHTAKAIKNAMRLLKLYGFKTDLHLMPQFPGSTPGKDLKMMKEVFDNQDYRPDMIKIYPCTVVKNSELYSWLKKGKYKPYSDKKLLETLIAFKTKVPRYVRISRLIRDIPSHHIEAGNKMTNLRQVIQTEMAKRGLKCNCLRCREIGHNDESKIKTPKLFIDKYEASNGMEYFLSFEDKKRTVVFAFCRLRIDKNGLFPSFIRELHTYGQSLAINSRNKKESQHQGFGKQLVAEAEKICKNNQVNTLAVISGVGVKEYYKKLGFKENQTYLVKKL